MRLVQSPNDRVMPATARINDLGHLEIGGIDSVELAKRFATPLWVLDEQTIVNAIDAYSEGLEQYPDWQILYAGKAFLCLAMCHLIKRHKLGLDVVSSGELFTAQKAGIAARDIYMHGNNKSAEEIEEGLRYGDLKIVVDSESELALVAGIAKSLGTCAKILFRIIPGVEPDTHAHIVTGHADSKFGVALETLNELVKQALDASPHVELLGLHAHIGSQAKDLAPYNAHIEILADTLHSLKKHFGLELPLLDVGGGLGIAYIDDGKPVSIYDWTRGVAQRVTSCLRDRNLALPKLLIEPGRSIVGTAGVTLYTAGHKKQLPSGVSYIAVDGGMADNPRPITYDAPYTAAVANRMNAAPSERPAALAGKFCESGDIIIKEAYLPAETGDLIAVFGTGAYNYSMASNYNRTARPACVLVSNGEAEIIIQRESRDDLLRQDRVPDRLLR